MEVDVDYIQFAASPEMQRTLYCDTQGVPPCTNDSQVANEIYRQSIQGDVVG